MSLRSPLLRRSSLFLLALGLGYAPEARAGIVFHEDFESGTGAWTLNGAWTTTSIGPHSPTLCLSDSSGNYSNNIITETVVAKTVALNLSAAQKPRLMFWMRFSSEQFHDYLYVDASKNGTTWNKEMGAYTGTAYQNWRSYEITLPGYEYEPIVYLRFRVQTDPIISDDGWYIDDVVVDDGNPAVTITAPDANTVWPGGSNQDITWTYDGSYDPLASYMKVYYSDDNIIYWTLGQDLPTDTTSWPWTLPSGDLSAVRVRVELYDADDLLLSQTTTQPFKIDSTAPGIFALTSPADTACGSSIASFDWGDAADANGVKYTLTVTPASGPAFEKTGISGSQYTLSAGEALSSADSPYTWSVTAVDPAGHSRTSSSTRTYQADSIAPTAVALSAPADGTSTDGAGVVFAWDTTTDDGCGLSHYALYVDETLCADNLSLATTSIALDATSCTPLASGDHTWSIAAVDLAGNVSSSSEWGLTVIGDEPDPSGGAGGESGTSGSGGTPDTGSGGVSSEEGGSGGEPVAQGGAPSTGNGGAGNDGAGGEPGPSAGGTGPTGTAGSSGSTGSGARGGTTSSSGRGGQSAGGAGATAAANASSDDEGGCGCRVTPRSQAGHFTTLLALLAGLAFAGRRPVRAQRGGRKRDRRNRRKP